MNRQMFDGIVQKLSKVRKPKKKTVKYWLLMLLVPSVLLIDENGKDKSGLILSGILLLDAVLFLILLIFTGHANVLCFICYIAVNVWGWLMHITSEPEN